MICPQELSALEKKSLKSSTSEIKQDLECTLSAKESTKKYHAHHILKVLTAHLPKTQKLQITHKNVFDSQGKHSINLWKEVITELKSRPAQLIVLAVGSSKDSLQNLKLPTQHFYLMASGQANREYSAQAVLWPQKLLIEGRLKGALIGAFTGKEGEKSPDQTPAILPELLHLQHIDYYFREQTPGLELSGSSHATALAATRLIQLCGDRPLNMWTHCLKKNQRELVFLRDKKGQTF